MARLGAMSTGRRIAALRRERGWSQSQLAAALATASGRSTITREEISRWEPGRRTPTPYWLSHLAAVLRVPVGRPAPRSAGPLAGRCRGGARRGPGLAGQRAPPQVTARRPGRRVGASLAAEVQARIARLRHLDDTLPGYELAPVAAAEFDATAALVRDASFSEQTGRARRPASGRPGRSSAGSKPTWACTTPRRRTTSRACAPPATRATWPGRPTSSPASYTCGPARPASATAGSWPRPPSGALRAGFRRALLHERLAYASAHAGDGAGTARALGPVDDLIEGRTCRPSRPARVDLLARPRRGRRDGGPVRHPARPRRDRGPLIRAALGRYSTGHRREWPCTGRSSPRPTCAPGSGPRPPTRSPSPSATRPGPPPRASPRASTACTASWAWPPLRLGRRRAAAPSRAR